ncbi:Holin-like toxin [Paenibacillus lupini]|nr:hypothetical protein [Paenibacillus lupini]
MKSHLIRIGGDSMSFLEIVALLTLLIKIIELTQKKD